MKKICDLVLSNGEEVELVLRLSDVIIKKTSSGDDYASMVGFDGSEKIEAKMWNFTEELRETLINGEVYKVLARTKQYQSRTQLNILQIEKITLYRIAQEACNNIVKHARASKIFIYLTFKKKEITLVIQDNGIGFDMEKMKKMEKDELYGLGLYTMKERTKLLNGKLDIKSVLQQGTTISITVPLKIEKGEF